MWSPVFASRRASHGDVTDCKTARKTLRDTRAQRRVCVAAGSSGGRKSDFDEERRQTWPFRLVLRTIIQNGNWRRRPESRKRWKRCGPKRLRKGGPSRWDTHTPWTTRCRKYRGCARRTIGSRRPVNKTPKRQLRKNL